MRAGTSASISRGRRSSGSCANGASQRVCHAVLGDERSGARALGVGNERVDKRVVVVGVVVEDRQACGVQFFHQTQAFLLSRVVSADKLGIFGVGVGAVVDQEVGAGDQVEDLRVGPARDVLGIRHLVGHFAAKACRPRRLPNERYSRHGRRPPISGTRLNRAPPPKKPKVVRSSPLALFLAYSIQNTSYFDRNHERLTSKT